MCEINKVLLIGKANDTHLKSYAKDVLVFYIYINTARKGLHQLKDNLLQHYFLQTTRPLQLADLFKMNCTLWGRQTRWCSHETVTKGCYWTASRNSKYHQTQNMVLKKPPNKAIQKRKKKILLILTGIYEIPTRHHLLNTSFPPCSGCCV